MEWREAGEVQESWESNKPRVADALSFLDASDREKWFTYGCAIFDASGGGDDGSAIWNEWAQTCREKYDQDVQDYYWDYEFDRDYLGERASLATIFDDAYKAGWKEEDSLITGEEQALHISDGNALE